MHQKKGFKGFHKKKSQLDSQCLDRWLWAGPETPLGEFHFIHTAQVFVSRPHSENVIHLGALDELLGGGLLVAELPFPCLQGRGLQGAAVGEGERPGLGQGAGVDGVEVDTGLLLRLAARQEGDP